MSKSLELFSVENGLNEEQKRELEELVDRLIFASLEEGAVVRSLSEIPGNEGDTEQTIENESAMEATLGGEVPRISGFEDTIQAEVADVNKLSLPQVPSSKQHRTLFEPHLLQRWSSWEAFHQRYEKIGLLGEGGMGEVYRMWDRRFQRFVAFKTLKEGRKRSLRRRRFFTEAITTAQLQHPGIVPVHEMGVFPDGRLYFAMKEVAGKTFLEVISEVHIAVQDANWQPTEGGWSFRRMVDVFYRVCETVGYAHSKGVFHRDIKPSNIMVGAHGEVLVVDWGLVKVADSKSHATQTNDPMHGEVNTDDKGKTQFGALLGTPAYMSPEQARGERGLYDERSDVYSLGALLYVILAGRPPYDADNPLVILHHVLSGPPTSPGRVVGMSTTDSKDIASTAYELAQVYPTQELSVEDFWSKGGFTDSPEVQRTLPPLPFELVSICAKAMAREPNDRYANATELAEAVGEWLDGALKRTQAERVVEKALALVPRVEDLRLEAAVCQARADDLRASSIRYAPEESKWPIWNLEDQALDLLRNASLLELKSEQFLHAALTHTPNLVQAHRALAELYQKEHAEAEGRRDTNSLLRVEGRLRTHVNALPVGHQTRHRLTAYLKGDGKLSLYTDPPGALVTLYRYQTYQRRLITIKECSLGVTPLSEQTLPMGSYLLLIQKEGYHDVRYPVLVERAGHWDGVPPDSNSASPIWLPPLGSLGQFDCYVPEGWFWCGGDPNTHTSLPRQQLWSDGFVMQTFPVTNREYIYFLDDLVRQGKENEAIECSPQRTLGKDSSLIYGRGDDGSFFLQMDKDGDLWQPNEAVDMISWNSAHRYAQWMREKTGLPWRLPSELEWEKAARGVDGRFFPWGDFHDPSWSCMRDSHESGFKPAEVDSFPIDTSPYGVRGMSGNVRDWCGDVYRADGPPLEGKRIVPSYDWNPSLDGHQLRARRGGSWQHIDLVCRAAHRDRFQENSRIDALGFRLVRPLHP